MSKIGACSASLRYNCGYRLANHLLVSCLVVNELIKNVRAQGKLCVGLFGLEITMAQNSELIFQFWPTYCSETPAELHILSGRLPIKRISVGQGA